MDNLDPLVLRRFATGGAPSGRRCYSRSRASGIARCTPKVGAGTFIQANAECKE